jgi:hypothetical protein
MPLKEKSSPQHSSAGELISSENRAVYVSIAITP